MAHAMMVTAWRWPTMAKGDFRAQYTAAVQETAGALPGVTACEAFFLARDVRAPTPTGINNGVPTHDASVQFRFGSEAEAAVSFEHPALAALNGGGRTAWWGVQQVVPEFPATNRYDVWLSVHDAKPGDPSTFAPPCPDSYFVMGYEDVQGWQTDLASPEMEAAWATGRASCGGACSRRSRWSRSACRRSPRPRPPEPAAPA